MAKSAAAKKAVATKDECLSTQVPQPEVLGGVVPYLNVDGATKAAEFYKKAFAATEVFAMPPDDKGRTMHIHLYINGGSLMLCDPYPEHGHPHEPAKGYTLHMRIEGLDAAWKRAVDAGCEIVLPLQKMFWGERYGQLRDPFGVMWSMSYPDA
ncbi:MAG: VOC family protein [Hyphomicrobiaceae bacterium]